MRAVGDVGAVHGRVDRLERRVGASSALSPNARRARCESRDRQGEAVMPRLRVPRAAAMRMPRPPRAAFVIVTTACRRWRCLTAPSSRRLLCPPTCGIARRSRARASAAHLPRRRPRIRCCEFAPYGSWAPWVVVVDDPCHVDSAHRSAELLLWEGAKPRIPSDAIVRGRARRSDCIDRPHQAGASLREGPTALRRC